MRPQSLTWFALILTLTLAACTSTDDTSETGTDADTDADGDSDTDLPVVWEPERAETSVSFTGVYASGQGIVAVSTQGMIWNFKQATGWDDEDADTEDEDLNDIWGIGSGAGLEFFAVGDAGKWTHFYSGGWITEDLGTANFEAVGGPTAELLYAVGWGGVYRWDGYIWTYEPVPPGAQINDVWATVDFAYAVGEDGLILRRENKTGGWLAMDSPTDLALFAIGGATPADLWAVGEKGVIVNFDGTADKPTFTVKESFTGQSLWDVWGIQNNAVYTVGGNGTAAMWDGDKWNKLGTGVDNVLYAVNGSTAFDVWAVGNRGMAIHYVVD